MRRYFDLHSHMLAQVDDGAHTPEEMFEMLDTAYADGVRGICLTPHFSPEMFGDTRASSEQSFALLRDYAAEKYPDLELFLGNELGYYDGCINAISEGRCRTLGGGRYLLVDFPEEVEFTTLQTGVGILQRSGFRVVLAHVERYHCLAHRFSWVEDFVASGGVVQVNASSITGSWGFAAKTQWKKLMKRGLVRVISTDAHNLLTRPPKFSVCMDFLEEHCHEDGINRLTWENARRIAHGELL